MKNDKKKNLSEMRELHGNMGACYQGHLLNAWGLLFSFFIWALINPTFFFNKKKSTEQVSHNHWACITFWRHLVPLSEASLRSVILGTCSANLPNQVHGKRNPQVPLEIGQASSTSSSFIKVLGRQYPESHVKGGGYRLECRA